MQWVLDRYGDDNCGPNMYIKTETIAWRAGGIVGITKVLVFTLKGKVVNMRLNRSRRDNFPEGFGS